MEHALDLNFKPKKYNEEGYDFALAFALEICDLQIICCIVFGVYFTISATLSQF